MAKLSNFYDARNLFIEMTQYTKPLTYEEWHKRSDTDKIGLLFVQFFNEIITAWEKADSIDFGDPAEGVSTVLQYLGKQVSQIIYYRKDNPSKRATAEFRRSNPDECIAVERRIIDSNPEKFSPRYIYRIAYNCLYCICGHDRKCDKDRINNETSPVLSFDGEEISVFDFVADTHGAASDQSEANAFEAEFWSIIENAGLPAEKVMRYLLSNNKSDLKALTTRCKQYKLDPLRDVEVSLDAVDDIIEQLRETFLSLPYDSPCGEYISKMHFAFGN